RLNNKAANSRARSRALPLSATTCNCPLRLRTRTKSAVSISLLVGAVFTTTLARARFVGAQRDDLVQSRALAFLLTQDSPQALNVCAHAARPTDDHRDVGVGYVYTFVEHLRGYNRVVFAGRKQLQNPAALRDFRLMRNDGHEKPF